MAGYCTSVQPYFHEPQASENTAQECNIQPCILGSHKMKGTAHASTCIDSLPTAIRREINQLGGK